MHKILIATVAGFLTILSVVSLADDVDKSSADGLHSLWVIESDTNRTYLLGSIHVLRDSDYPLPEAFYAAYEDAEQIVMEIDFEEIDPLAAMIETRRVAMLPDGTTLASVLGEEKYKEAVRLAENSDISLSMFSRVEPWFAAMTISQVQMQRMGFKAEKGVELHFTEKARRDDKPGSGLETMEQQFGFLDSLPVDAQIKFLFDSLADSEELAEQGEQMLVAWKTGDSESLENLFAEDLNDIPALRQSLLIDRNNNWIPKIIEFTQESEDYLVIVGALHLVGEDGVVQLLKDRGLKIRQL